jgi:hypothetical protein
MQPIHLIFDTPGNESQRVYLPKLVQGAPYHQNIRIRMSDQTYRDFSQYDDVIMRFVTEQGQPPFLTLSRLTGGIDTTEGIAIQLSADATDHVRIEVTNRAAINELRFLHTIELVNDGAVVERFAQGYGKLIASL